jgi:ATP-dependent DNA ligase
MEQLHIHGGKITVYSRSSYDWTAEFWEQFMTDTLRRSRWCEGQRQTNIPPRTTQ